MHTGSTLYMFIQACFEQDYSWNALSPLFASSHRFSFDLAHRPMLVFVYGWHLASQLGPGPRQGVGHVRLSSGLAIPMTCMSSSFFSQQDMVDDNTSIQPKSLCSLAYTTPCSGRLLHRNTS